MISSLTIVNNTPNEWRCRIGPDEKALKIAGIIVSVIGSIATIIGTGGAAAPIIAALGTTAITVTGVASTALTVIGALSTFALNIANGVNDNLISKGYNTIAAGQSHRYGELTLSLWQQGTCVRTYAVDGRTVRTETLYMRPIFSGQTAGSNRDHDIQWWINKNGIETKDVVGQPAPAQPGNNNNNHNNHNGAIKEFHAGKTNVTDLELSTSDIVIIYGEQQ